MKRAPYDVVAFKVWFNAWCSGQISDAHLKEWVLNRIDSIQSCLVYAIGMQDRGETIEKEQASAQPLTRGSPDE